MLKNFCTEEERVKLERCLRRSRREELWMKSEVVGDLTSMGGILEGIG